MTITHLGIPKFHQSRTGRPQEIGSSQKGHRKNKKTQRRSCALQTVANKKLPESVQEPKRDAMLRKLIGKFDKT